MFRIGDIVQLQSGGAPLTVADQLSRGLNDHLDMLKVVSVSAGGLLQETIVLAGALRLYDGPLTPASKDAPRAPQCDGRAIPYTIPKRRHWYDRNY